jgi:hypothetical protein
VVQFLGGGGFCKVAGVTLTKEYKITEQELRVSSSDGFVISGVEALGSSRLSCLMSCTMFCLLSGDQLRFATLSHFTLVL